MRFIFAIFFFALITCVFTEGSKYEDHKEEERKEERKEERIRNSLFKYFHKKMCYCIKESGGLCTVLKCCDVYKYVPYKVYIKLCKYGECKFISRESRIVHEEEEIEREEREEREAGISE